MKVKIGKYKNYIGPYQIATFLCFWAKKEKDELGWREEPRWVHDFGTWLAEDKHGKPSCLTKICQWIDSHRKRTIKIRIDPWDSWSADNTLAMIILPLLRELGKDKYGAPFTDDEDVPENIRSTSAKPKEDEYDIDEFHQARWDWILGEMIWAFTQITDDSDEDKFYSGESDILWQPLNTAREPIGEPGKINDVRDRDGISAYEVVKGPNHTHNVDIDGLNAHHARIKNGCRLFGKYYQSLWT